MLVVDDLRTHFHVPAGAVKAVDGVSLTLSKGTTLGVVGESGSGKTVLSRSIMGLNTADNAVTTGSVIYDGIELVGKSPKEMKDLWGAEMAMVFQDPMTSLNPVVKVGRQLTEHMRYHLGISKAEARERADRACSASVRIPEADERFDNYPHEMSGGMRQRVCIASALGVWPEAAVRRRADDRTRRDGAAPDPEPARPPTARAPHDDDHGHPRPRRGGHPRRRDRRDVRRQDRREGTDRRRCSPT